MPQQRRPERSRPSAAPLARSSIAEQTACDCSAGAGGSARLHSLIALRKVLGNRLRELGQWQRLQPHTSRADELRKEDPVASEDLVLDAGHGRDVELHGVLEQPDVAGVHAQHLALLQVVRDDLAGELDPRLARATDLLQPEPVATEEPGAEPLLERDRELDTVVGADERVAVTEVCHAGLRRNVDREDRAGKAGCERHHAGETLRRVLGHEDRATAHGALEDAADAATATEL